MKLKYIACCIFLLALIGCKKEEIPEDSPYPRINTLEVTDITETGATFNAYVEVQDNHEVVEYGFVWEDSKKPNLERSDKVKISDPIEAGKFSIRVSTSLEENKSYYVRAFVKTVDYLVYGEHKKFKSLGSNAPQIDTIYPLSGTIGDTVYLFGKGFSFDQNKNEVYFDDLKAEVINATDSSLVVLVPKVNKDTYTIESRLAGNGYTYKDSFTITNHSITDIHPLSGTFGDIVTIEGSHFSYSLPDNKVYLDDVRCEVVSANKTQLKVIVSDKLNQAKNSISYSLAGQTVTHGQFRVNPPRIFSITPSYIDEYYKGTILIKGENFNPRKSKNQVSINGFNANIINSSGDEITCDFPSELIPDIDISVMDSLDVKLSVLDQDTILENSMIINFLSRWTRMKDFPGSPRILGLSESLNGKGYIGLGEKGAYKKWYNDFWEYDPATDKWEQQPNFPGSSRSSFVSFTLEGKIYIVSGTAGSPNAVSNNLKEVWTYNPTTKNWLRKNDFPGEARHSAFGFSINGFGYMGGGRTGDDWDYRKDFWKYDPSNDTWEKLNDLQIIKDEYWTNNATSIGLKNQVFLLTSEKFNTKERFNWRFNETSYSWDSVSSLPEELFEVVALSIGNNIYVGTGFDNAWAGSNQFYRYHPPSDNWNSFEFKGGKRRQASSFVIDNKHGYILLGRSSSHTANKTDVWKFDPTKPE